jgi:hypothetical protein
VKLYVNGDSHAAAAEAVNQHAFAADDGRYFYLGRAPHPDNAQKSWARKLSDVLKTALYLDAESASSNQRIIRTTREWVQTHKEYMYETLVIIQWSTWEREEWKDNSGRYHQVNASGIDDVPEELKQRYKEFVVGVDWSRCTSDSHAQIWQFHLELKAQGIKHIFFNGNNHFEKISQDQRHDWGTSYIGPYDPAQTYDAWLKSNGYSTVSPNSWHFGEHAHTAWSRFVLQYIVTNKYI